VDVGLIDDHGAGFDWPAITRMLIDTIPWQVETAQFLVERYPSRVDKTVPGWGTQVAIEARGDAPPVFEAAEHAFDDVALLVDGLV
jgi:hypothetical protein